jgi:hypothetical protein
MLHWPLPSKVSRTPSRTVNGCPLREFIDYV